MHEWVWHVWDYLRLSREHDIHISFFEGFNTDFQQELAQLLHYLEINFTENQRTELEEAVSFKTLQKKNPKHLKKGTSGYWMDQLTDDQLYKAEVIAGPLLRYLNYPLDRNQPISFGSNLAEPDFESLKQEIISSQQTLQGT